MKKQRFTLMVEVEADSEEAAITLLSSPVISVLEAYPSPDDVWDSDAEFPREDWQYEVGNGDTNLGYWAWVSHQREFDQDEHDFE